MMRRMPVYIFVCVQLLSASTLLIAQQLDTVRYIGKTLSNIDYHHGQLSPALGVHNIQVMRARRTDTTARAGYGWTYNHAPMICYWNNRFYLEYLSNPVGEHVPPGQTLLMRSENGYEWSDPKIVFPPYKIPDGTVKEGKKDTAKNLYAVMHQRVGFYVSTDNRLLIQGYYGMVIGQKDDPNDGNGIGRVVREVNQDGSLGPVYFIRYNHAFNPDNTSYPYYLSAKDKGFIKACNELLSKPLYMQQWVEEADKDDSLIPLKKDFKAFNYYHLKDGRAVGLWKYALTSITKDEGKTWQYNPTRAPGFVNANAKIWGQKTMDGKYLTVYNPSEFRWPLAVSVSADGLKYENLLLVNGEISSMRYGGAYKSYGPQYVRGIQEGEGIPYDKNCWVTYSMNKEDIWVSKIPVPVKSSAEKHAADDFAVASPVSAFNQWNIYSPLWASVSIGHTKDGSTALMLKDSDPFDYAKAERMIPASKKVVTEFALTPMQNNFGLLDIEWLDAKGTPCIRLSFDSTGSFITKAGYRNKSLIKYNAGETYKVKLELDTRTRFYSVQINGKNAGMNLFFAPIETVERISFRTGSVRRFPDADTPTDQQYDLPNTEGRDREAIYYIQYLKTGEN